MKFKIGKYYQNKHGIGQVLHIIGEANTTFHGFCLLGEREDGSLAPIGRDVDNARGYHEVSGWPRRYYAANNIPEPSEPTIHANNENG